MELRTRVIARLGYDPFSATANRIVLAIVEREGEQLHAKVDLADAEGSIQGVRELNAPANDCTTLIRALALSISIAIDPSSALENREGEHRADADQPAEPHEASSPELLEQRRLGALPKAKPLRTSRFFTGTGLHLTLGAGPALGYGGDLVLGIRNRNLSLSLEGRGDPMVMAPSERGGEIGALFMLASLVPCLHQYHLAFCVLASAGFVRASSDQILVHSSDTGFYAAAGVRLGVDWPLTERVELLPHVDLATPLPRQHIQVYETKRETLMDAWTSPALSGQIGMHLVAYY
jgi:hypothetical protein